MSVDAAAIPREMTQGDICQKCGAGSMIGPSYCAGRCAHMAGKGAREHLHFRCDCCGYVARVSTLDQQVRP